MARTTVVAHMVAVAQAAFSTVQCLYHRTLRTALQLVQVGLRVTSQTVVVLPTLVETVHSMERPQQAAVAGATLVHRITMVEVVLVDQGERLLGMDLAVQVHKVTQVV